MGHVGSSVNDYSPHLDPYCTITHTEYLIPSGGRKLTVTGMNLHAAQDPKMFAFRDLTSTQTATLVCHILKHGEMIYNIWLFFFLLLIDAQNMKEFLNINMVIMIYV